MKTIKLFLSVVFFAVMIYHCGNGDNPVTNNGGQGNNSDTTFRSFVILYTGSTPVDTLYFADRNLCIGQYNSSTNSTYCLLNDTASQQNISVSFPGNTTGSFVFTFGFLSYQGGSYNGSSITGTVSLYESVGGKIKGTYNGIFSDGSTTYNIIASFTVRRTQ
jgi:hypothetical protein